MRRLSPMVAENWDLIFVIHCNTIKYRKEENMSFIEYLIKLGYTYDEANTACVCIENDLPLPETIEEYYWTWWNNKILQKGDEI